jgi:hypothetical protein
MDHFRSAGKNNPVRAFRRVERGVDKIDYRSTAKEYSKLLARVNGQNPFKTFHFPHH